MKQGDGLPERVGKTINQLDIDFSSFTLAGWAVSVLSLALGLVLGLLAWWITPNDPSGKAKALAFGLTMIATTVLVFISVRWSLAQFDVSLVNRQGSADDQISPG